MKNRLLRYWSYFRRGHNIYLIFAISFLNTIVIQWRLLIEKITFLESFFKQLWIFSILFFITYIPIATLIGWTDYKRGSVPVDAAVTAQVSPWIQDFAKAITLLSEGKNEEVVELMKKWVKKK